MSIDDDATAAEERDRDLCLRVRKTQLKHCGKCYNCLESIDKGNFCDGDCREDYERRKRFQWGVE